MESTTSMSSQKCFALEDPTASSPVMCSMCLCDTIPPVLSNPTPNDINAYMDSQGKSNVLQPTLFPPSHQSNPFLSHSVPQDALSSMFLRFQAIKVICGMPLIAGFTWTLVSK